MDKDSDVKLVGKGYARHIQNFIGGTRNDGESGERTNIPGILSLPQIDAQYGQSESLITGLDKIVGAAEDTVNQRIYYLVYNSNGFHRIQGFDFNSNEAIGIVTNDTVDSNGTYPLLDGTITLSTLYPNQYSWICMSKEFDFRENTLFDCVILDGTWLVFTDGETEPKAIDVTKDYSNRRIDGTGATFNVSPFKQITKDEFTLIKKAPQKAPTVTTVLVEDRPVNNIKGKQFQFCYQYKYVDGRYSAPSPWSKLGQDLEFGLTGDVEDPTVNNALLVIGDGFGTISGGVYTPQTTLPEGVTAYRWLVKEGVGDWKIIDSENSGVLFFNDGGFTSISQSIANQLYNYVPRTAKTLAVSSNRIVLGNIEEGYPVPEIEASAAFTYDSIAAGSSTPTLSTSSGTDTLTINIPTINASHVGTTIWVYLNFGNALGNEVFNISDDFNGTAYANKFQKSNFVNSISVSTTVQSGWSATDVRKALFSEIKKKLKNANNGNSLYANGFPITQIGSGYTETVPTYYVFDTAELNKKVVNFSESGSSITIATPPVSFSAYLRTAVGDEFEFEDPTVISGYDVSVSKTLNLGASVTFSYSQKNEQNDMSFKSGVNHNFGIVYFDEFGRSISVLTNGALSAYCTHLTERAGDSTRGKSKAVLTIKNRPPSWAKTYQIYYTPRSYISDFIYCKVDTVIASGSEYVLELSPITNYIDQNENTNLSYDFVSGDRVRLVYDDSAAAWTSTDKSFEVLAFDETTFTIKVDSSLTIGTDDWIEIYRPSKSKANQLWYAIPHTYEIKDGYHMGHDFYNTLNTEVGVLGDVNQTSSLPAVLRINEIGREFGDCYIRVRTMTSTSGNDFLQVESYNFSDFFESNLIGTGKPNLVDPEYGKKTRPTRIYYSEPYVSENNFNRMSTFFETNYKDLDISFGGIYKLFGGSEALEVYQQDKVGLVYVNRSLINDLSGQSLMGISSTLFSEPKYFNENYGIGKLTHSFSSYGKYRFFCDPKNRSIIMMAGNQMEAISNNKMRSHFNSVLSPYFTNEMPYAFDLSKFNVISGIQPARNEVYFSVPKFTTFEASIINEAYSSLGELTRVTVTKTSDFDDVDVGDTIMFRDSIDRVVYGSVAAVLSTTVLIDVKYPSTIFSSYPEVTQMIKVKRDAVVYSIDNNSWESFISYDCEYMLGFGGKLILFKGFAAEAEADFDNYNTFFGGRQYDSYITIVSNDSPMQNKVYLATGVKGDNFDEVTITNQKGQATSLLGSDFENLEDFYYSNLLMDANTPNVTDPLFNGDPMRSQELSLTFSTSNTTKFDIFSIFVRYLLSSNYVTDN